MITLKTLKRASSQTVFNQVATHLLTQNKQSLSHKRAGFDACRYRGPRGLKCALGCLIADGEYKRSFEGEAWDGLVDAAKVPSAHLDLLTALQEVHDESLPEEWREKLRGVAKLFGLKTKVLEVQP